MDAYSLSKMTRLIVFHAGSGLRSAHRANPGGANAEFDVRFELRAEMVEHVFDRCPCGLTKPTVGKILQAFAEPFQMGDVFHGSTPFRNIGQDLPSLIGADATWNAFAAAFLLEEAREDAY